MGSVSAILTAAGASTRMGRLKPLLPWKGVTLIEHQVRCLTDAGCAEVVAVLGHRASDVSPYIRGPSARVAINTDYEHGKTNSIKAGLRAIDPGAGAILFLAVDQPRTAGIVSAVISSHLEKGAPITSPRHRGRGGHPLIFDASLKSELEAVSEGGHGILEVYERYRGLVNKVQVEDPIVRLDLNTPDEYRTAYEKYGVEQEGRVGAEWHGS